LSAEGAALNSRGRKAVDQDLKMKTRPEGPAFLYTCDTGFNAAPSALDY
jgi:hypothetical protein